MLACRSFVIDKKGELAAGRAREKAHRDRVSAILAHGGFLYSTSYDGSVKVRAAPRSAGALKQSPSSGPSQRF